MLQYLLLIFLVGNSLCHGQEDWKYISTKDDVKIYTKITEESQILALKVTTTFSTSLEKLEMLILDIPSQMEYVDGCKLSKLIKTTNKKEQIYYQQSNFPWPFKDRDGLFIQKIDHNKELKTTTIESNAVDYDWENNKNYIKIKKLHTIWTLIPISDSKVKAEYQIFVDPGGKIPYWLINFFITTSPHKSIVKMKLMLASPD